MKSIGLSAYNICVRDADNVQYELHDIKGHSLIEIINNEIRIGLNIYDNDRHEERVFAYEYADQRLELNEQDQPIYDAFYLRVKTGEYGVEAEIIDSATGDVMYTKRPREADVMPFGCCLMVPRGACTSGIILFQSIARYGITTEMKKRIDGYLKRIDGSLRVVMGPVMPRAYAERLLTEGILKSVRIIRYGIPDDDCDRYGIDRGTQKVVEERLLENQRVLFVTKLTQ